MAWLMFTCIAKQILQLANFQHKSIRLRAGWSPFMIRYTRVIFYSHTIDMYSVWGVYMATSSMHMCLYILLPGSNCMSLPYTSNLNHIETVAKSQFAIYTLSLYYAKLV